MASQNVMEFTTANWEQEVVQSDKPVLVDFFAHWCGPCRMLTPTIERLADKFAGKVKVGKLNTEDSPDIASNYQITTIPQIFIFKGGNQPREKMIGVVAESELEKAIKRVLEAK